MIGEVLMPGYISKDLKPHRLSLLSIWQDDGFGNPKEASDIEVCHQAVTFIYEDIDGTFYTPDRRRPRS